VTWELGVPILASAAAAVAAAAADCSA